MVEHLNRASWRNWLTGLGFLMGLGLGACHAETLPDPTRPSGSASAGGVVDPEAGEGVPVLQSVLISPGHKEVIINGQTVVLGGRFGEARLIRIGEGEVTLQTGNAFKTLKLFPEVDKRMRKEKAGAKHPK